MTGRDEIRSKYGASAIAAIDDFLDHTEMADRLLDRDPEESDYETYFLAIEGVMNRLGESAKRMGDEFIADHPELKLREIKDARNWVAHEYHDISHERIIAALENELPATVEKLKRLLA